MRTVIESPTFQKQADALWTEAERLAFVDWIANNPLAGDVIQGTGGARKVRWAMPGRGKRGGARVVYVDHLADGTLVLVMMYAKNDREDVPAHEIRRSL